MRCTNFNPNKSIREKFLKILFGVPIPSFGIILTKWFKAFSVVLKTSFPALSFFEGFILPASLDQATPDCLFDKPSFSLLVFWVTKNCLHVITVWIVGVVINALAFPLSGPLAIPACILLTFSPTAPMSGWYDQWWFTNKNFILFVFINNSFLEQTEATPDSAPVSLLIRKWRIGLLKGAMCQLEKSFRGEKSKKGSYWIGWKRYLHHQRID